MSSKKRKAGSLDILWPEGYAVGACTKGDLQVILPEEAAEVGGFDVFIEFVKRGNQVAGNVGIGVNLLLDLHQEYLCGRVVFRDQINSHQFLDFPFLFFRHMVNGVDGVKGNQCNKKDQVTHAVFPGCTAGVKG